MIRLSVVRFINQIYLINLSLKYFRSLRNKFSSSMELLTKVDKSNDEKSKAKKDNRLQTTYVECLIHLCKSNIGPGCFAMSEAIKNSGLILGSTLTVMLSTICVYQQHVLIKCSDIVKEEFNLEKRPDYAETLQLSLMSNENWRQHAKVMKRICNIFLILSQFGFCSVFFLFIGNNVKHVTDFYDFKFDLEYLMIFSLVPIVLTSLITNLKYLGKRRQECREASAINSDLFESSSVFRDCELMHVRRNYYNILLLCSGLAGYIGKKTSGDITSSTAPVLRYSDIPFRRNRGGVAIEELNEGTKRLLKATRGSQCRDVFPNDNVHLVRFYRLLAVWRQRCCVLDFKLAH